MVTLPAARALIACPETFFLGSLPVPEGWIGVALAVGLWWVELPWVALWVLDEPISGLNPQGVGLIRESIAERQSHELGTLLSTHDQNWSATLDGSLYRLHHGKLRPGA
ncbi:ABC transporter ATP-binding protein [Myxococcota bacterium]